MNFRTLYLFIFFIPYEVSAGKRDQIEFFFKKKFLSKIDVDLIIWSRTFVISKKIFLSICSLFSALTPYGWQVYLQVQTQYSLECNPISSWPFTQLRNATHTSYMEHLLTLRK